MKRAPQSVRWLLGLVFDNFVWKLLALGIAVVLWVFVASEPELSTFATVPLEYKNLPADVEISSTLIESVSLEVRGPTGELRNLTDVRRPAVILDMSAVRPGSQTFTIGSGNVRLPRGLRLVRAIPSQVRFDFERHGSREIPVRVRFGPDRVPGYEVASVNVIPPMVRITGPESHVARAASAVTDPIDLDGLTSSAEFRVNAFLEDAYVRFQSSPLVVVTVKMKQK
jgi:YbbR domain-containing protein